MRKIKVILFIFLYLVSIQNSISQNTNRIKNLIILIPDGTSIDVLSLARWYNGNMSLNIDPLICGMIKTYSCDSTIADSAPSSTAYATGNKSKSGYVGVDCFQNPGVSIMELAKMKGLSTGLVFTCQFPHATPADFFCHYPYRDDYTTLKFQMLYNKPQIVFGGGQNYCESNNFKSHLCDSMNYFFTYSLKEFRSLNKSIKKDSVWAIFSDYFASKKSKAMSYEIDRDTLNEPSISEMTSKAIEILSKNKKGFVLMVEGSKIDWAAHANDPKSVITDFLAFDKAVGVAVKFAKENDSTLVIVCPDHGNGGITLGNKQNNGDKDAITCNSNKTISYDKMNIYNYVSVPLQKVKASSEKVATILLSKRDSLIKEKIILNDIIFPIYGYNFDVNETNKMIRYLSKYAEPDVCNYRDSIVINLGHLLSRRSYIGWTTNGHTGEDVFLGIYSPDNNQRITGIIENSDIARYITKILNLGDLVHETEKFYSSHKKLFNNTDIYSLTIQNSSLIVKNKKNNKSLIIPANRNFYFLSENQKMKKILINTITVYNPSNETFFIPAELKTQIQ